MLSIYYLYKKEILKNQNQLQPVFFHHEVVHLDKLLLQLQITLNEKSIEVYMNFILIPIKTINFKMFKPHLCLEGYSCRSSSLIYRQKNY